MAHQLKRGLIVLAAALAVFGCEQQVGPNDQTISGKEYKEIVNSTTPENERNMTNTERDKVLAPGVKR
ncbi:MAG: hypothetical protein SFX74_01865 [Fimbriimonadaceae bacterium]|nr:hypothetical protein [Fimbriimonadaceae bacterium]